MINLIQGDALEVMRGMEAETIDAIVTDPPYGLKFMGKKWDAAVPGVEVWAEALRVLKPGGHLLAFFGTRTYHRGVVAIEDAGFEIRDCILYLYGQGFPKSLDVSKAIDKEAGEPRDVIGKYHLPNGHEWDLKNDKVGGGLGAPAGLRSTSLNITAPATAAAKEWDGWGTALKPACEIICLARKPLAEKTVARNVLKHRTGGLNIKGCRISTGGNLGRWPANVVHDGSDEVIAGFPDVKAGTAVRKNRGGNTFGGTKPKPPMDDMGFADSGSASRFFYTAKVSPKERGPGNDHCTVKPISLMQWLCRLVTPPGGLILDPFLGSGTTGIAALREGFSIIGIEIDPHYLDIARARIANDSPLFNKPGSE
jgi:site-specific DNA-methyltransferase (adenine-specific)